MRHGGLHGCGAHDLPFRGAFRFAFDPASETALHRGLTTGEFFRQIGLQLRDLRRVSLLLRFDVRRGDVVSGLVGVVEQRHDAVVVGVQDGIVFVRVALAAVQREAHPGRAGDADAVHHRVKAVFIRVDAAFFIQHRVSMKPGGDDVLRRGIRQHVSGELLDAELIEGHVIIQRLHDPVAIGPDLARAVFLEAVRVRITCEIEPAARPAFAVLFGGKEYRRDFS
jgi:hypothetical protein